MVSSSFPDPDSSIDSPDFFNIWVLLVLLIQILQLFPLKSLFLMIPFFPGCLFSLGSVSAAVYKVPLFSGSLMFSE